MARPPTKGTGPGTQTRPPTTGGAGGGNTRPPGASGVGGNTRPPGASGVGGNTRPPTSGPVSTRAPVSGRGAWLKDTPRPSLRPPPSRPDEQEVAGPPPPKTTLDEVERALSTLDGRHHDAAKAQRETQLAIAARRAAAEAEVERA